MYFIKSLYTYKNRWQPVLLLLCLVYTLAGCVTTTALNVKYRSFSDQSHDSRAKPASAYTGSIEELLKGNYLLIGYIDVERNIRKCFEDYTCQEVSEEVPKDPDIAQSVAERGGDVFTVLEKKIQLVPVTKSVCTSYYSTSYYINGQLYTNTSCGSWAYYSGYMEQHVSRALVWRFSSSPVDPEKNYKAVENAMTFINNGAKFVDEEDEESTTVSTDTNTDSDIELSDGDLTGDVTQRNKNLADARNYNQNRYKKNNKRDKPKKVTNSRKEKQLREKRFKRYRENKQRYYNQVAQLPWKEFKEYCRRSKTQKDTNGRNMLMLSLIVGANDMTTRLIENRCGIHNKDKKGLSVTEYALQMGQLEHVQKLVSYGIKLDGRKSISQIVLHHVAYNPDARLMPWILKNYKFPLNQRTRNGRTALLIAVYEGNIDTVKLLIKHGADTKLTVSNGTTLLMVAAQSDNIDIMKLMVKHGADINTTDSRHNTALFYAAAEGSPEAVQYLLQQGSNLYHKNRRGDTVLKYAVKHQNYETITYLIESGHRLEASNYDFYKLLIAARNDGNHAFLKFITREHPRLLSRKELSREINQAVINRDYELVEYLLQQGANINYLDSSSRTPLINAVEHRDYNIVRLLLNNKADWNIKYNDNLTAIMIATVNGDLEMITLFREHGVRN